jgi:hypothetical protein
MDDSRHRSTLKVCDHYRRGVLNASEACSSILFFSVEPASIADYLTLLPNELRDALIAFLPTLPVSDEGWVHFRGIRQLDGNEWSWAHTISECRANAEAARTYLSVEVCRPPAADFTDRVRAAYRKRFTEFNRGLVNCPEGRSGSDGVPDPAGGAPQSALSAALPKEPTK